MAKSVSKFSPPKQRFETWPLGVGMMAIHPSGLVADLDAETRRDIESSIPIHAHAVRAAVFGRVGHVQPVVALLELERAVGLYLIAVNPVRAAIAHVEQSLIR